AERRLPFVEIHELQLGLNRHGVFQFLSAVYEDGELSALDIDLEKIDIVDFLDIVQAPCLDRDSIDHPGVALEEAEDLESGRAGHERARPTGIGAQVERVFLSITNRIWQVDLAAALLAVQLRERGSLGLEPGDATEPSVQKRLVGRHAIDRVG